jgi:hypothetical protein
MFEKGMRGWGRVAVQARQNEKKAEMKRKYMAKRGDK